MASRGKLSQSQAARCANVSRTQIHRLVKGGGLSVERGEDGTVLIDASELLRVYPNADLSRTRAPRDRVHRTQPSDDRNSPGAEVLRREVELLHERIQGLEADKAHLRADVDRLMGVVEQQQRLLTDQRPRAAPVHRPWPGLRAWWRRVWEGDAPP